MKGINTLDISKAYVLGKPWTQNRFGGSIPPQGAGYVSLRSRLSLGNGTNLLVPLLSLVWESTDCSKYYKRTTMY